MGGETECAERGKRPTCRLTIHGKWRKINLNMPKTMKRNSRFSHIPERTPPVEGVHVPDCRTGLGVPHDECGAAGGNG